MNMNGSDVNYAAEQCAGHPVLGPATKFLKLLMDSVNEQSDGWAYWSPPSKASGKLQEFIKSHVNVHFMPNHRTEGATIDAFKKTLGPIRAMVTLQKKKQAQYGNSFNFDVDWAIERAMDKPMPPPAVSRSVVEFKVWRISSNTGSFGHNEFFITSKGGTTFKVMHIQSNEEWKMYHVLKVPMVGTEYVWHNLGIEGVPVRLEPNAPQEVIDMIWEERAHGEQGKKPEFVDDLHPFPVGTDCTYTQHGSDHTFEHYTGDTCTIVSIDSEHDGQPMTEATMRNFMYTVKMKDTDEEIEASHYELSPVNVEA